MGEKGDTEYVLRRAEQEAIQSIAAATPAAAAAHYELCLRHSLNALHLLKRKTIDPHSVTITQPLAQSG